MAWIDLDRQGIKVVVLLCSLVVFLTFFNDTATTEIYTYTPAPTALVSGTVFTDENGNGIYDANSDIPIPGVIVSAYEGGVSVASDMTDEHGRYLLSAPGEMNYTIRVVRLSDIKCYDPEFKTWNYWNTVEGQIEDVYLTASGLDISVSYRMLNYGPEDFSWELWHEGPVFGQNNVVLVHGAHISIIPLILELGSGKVKGMPDLEFDRLGQLLQQREHGQFNVWEFEYADVKSAGKYWTHGNITEYGGHLQAALDVIRKFNKGDISIVAHSMGGLVSRYAAQNMGGVDKILTLATGHFGFEYTWLGTAVFDYPCITQMEPGSEFLWDLNSNFQHGSYQLASFAASEDEPRITPFGGIVRYSSASMVQCHNNGNVTYDTDNTYFTIVPGTHEGIKEINLLQEDENREDDFVFEGIKIFLENGVSGRLNSWSEFMYPGDHNTRPHFSFRFMEPTPEGYPIIRLNGKRIYSFDMYTTEGERLIWNFRGGVGESGQVIVDYAGEELKYGWLTGGQSSIMKEIIDNRQ
jgi:pimeloyl-ACP methyl ester carboxylesterase